MNFIETKNSLFILVAMTAVATPMPALPEILIDRDLSWLNFNQRVLAEARGHARGALPPGKLLPMLETQARCFREQIVPALARHSVHLRH